jgi:hypothetical protein
MEDSILKKIFKKLDVELTKLNSQNSSPIIQAETAAGICQLALDELRKLVIKNGFESEQEEIQFFKHIKPKVLGKYIYYLQLFEIESHRNNASTRFQIKYLNQISKDLHKYLNENIQFCQYYWGNKTSLDKFYFLRENSNYRISVNNICVLMDYKYSTARDAMAAAVIAYEQLIKYIDKEIDILRFGSSRNEESFISNANWTDSTTSLVELIYALQSSGAINNGNIEINELAQIFEKMFNIKIDDYYRVFLDIKGRKKSQTKFLDKLTHELIRRINDSEA